MALKALPTPIRQEAGDLELVVSSASRTAKGTMVSLFVQRGREPVHSCELLLTVPEERVRVGGQLAANGQAAAAEQALLLLSFAVENELRALEQKKPETREKPEPKGRAIELEDPEPAEEPVDGAGLLDEMVDIIMRFIVLPPEAAAAVALWCVHTFMMDTFDVTPLLALSSPVKRCGKTSLLRLIAGLVRRPLPASSISAAAIYRTVEEHEPCLLIDEMDTMRENEDLRGILNSGHTRDLAFVVRCVGEGANLESRTFSTWCPKVLAHIGRLKPTLEDRAIRISMRRKEPGEVRERLRRRSLEALLRPIRRKVARWAQDTTDAITEPSIPDQLDDRAADNWEPLLSIAAAAGGRWPDLARRASLRLSVDRSGDETDENPKLLVLADLRDLIETGKIDTTNGLSGEEACAALRALEERPWRTWGRKGKDGLLPVHLSGLLRDFGIKSKQVRHGSDVVRRFPTETLLDAFARYLSGGAVAGATPATGSDPLHANPDGSTLVAGVAGVAGLEWCSGSSEETATEAEVSDPADCPGCGSDSCPGDCS